MAPDTSSDAPDIPDASSPGDVKAFPHAVASFDPTASSVLLWARTERSDRVHWIVARDGALDDVVASGDADVRADRDHTVVVDVHGLEPATSYHFAFEADGARSLVARTRTLPTGSTARARLGVVACANLARAPLAVYRALAGIDDLDLVLHMGDYIYEDAGDAGDIPVDPPHDLVTTDDYRRRYRQARADTDLQQLHLRYPFVAIWDDHDVADNTWDGGAKAHDPEEHGPWRARLEAATTARQEWLPARLREPDDEGLLWRSLELGDLAEVVVLDARLGGRDEALDSADGDGDIESPDRKVLSPEQWEWATERVADRSRPWTLVTSQIPVSEMRLPMPDGVNLDPVLPEGYTVMDGVGICTDQWDGYAAEQRRLAEVLGGRGGGAVLLSADVHSSWIFDGPFRANGEPVAGELTGSSVSSTTMGGNLGPAATGLAERIAADMDHVCWVDLDEHGFIVVDVTPERVRGEMWKVDPYDTDARAERMTAWQIGPEAGARWQEADDAAAEVDDDEEPVAVEGPAPLGPPAGGRAPSSKRTAGGKLVRAVGAAGVLIALRPVLRAARAGVRAGRSNHR